jgi:hypothetical protein
LENLDNIYILGRCQQGNEESFHKKKFIMKNLNQKKILFFFAQSFVENIDLFDMISVNNMQLSRVDEQFCNVK